MIDHNGSGPFEAPARTTRGASARSTSTVGSHPDTGMRVLSYLIAGIVFYGGLGWLVDHIWHQVWGVPAGLVLGMGLSIYMIVRRFGGQQ